jgi:phage repressor protein C with HTH and peptisase S24 domain
MQENKQEKSPIKQKILLYLDKKGISAYDFYKKSGVTRGVLGQNNGISEDNLSRFLAYASDINILWLMTGKGDMICSPPLPQDINSYKDKQNISTDQIKVEESEDEVKDMAIQSISKNPDSHQTPSQPTASSSMPTTSAGIRKLPQGSQKGIPLIPLSAMAGAFTSDISVMEYECERYVVPSFEGADFLIPVKGDSMQPTYLSGDLVACQKISLTDIFFQWNKTYVLDTDQGALIKRVCQGSDTDHILLVSDNECYPPFELSLSHLHAIALVRGIIRLE